MMRNTELHGIDTGGHDEQHHTAPQSRHKRPVHPAQVRTTLWTSPCRNGRSDRLERTVARPLPRQAIPGHSAVRGQRNAIPYASTCTADAKITSWTETRKKCQAASTSRMLGQPRTTIWTRHVTPITSSHTLLLLHHMHCYYSITCTDITSSHALLLLSYMHCYYFIT